jgi:hypothetical protein
LKKTSRPNYYEFPYIRFHGQHYPLIPVTLHRGDQSVNTFALLDSGASISVFRPEIARALKLPVRHPDEAHLGTANGGIRIGISRVDIEVEETRFSAKVGFSETFATSFNILGRQGFFPKFSVCFNEMMRTVIMVPLQRARSSR